MKLAALIAPCAVLACAAHTPDPMSRAPARSGHELLVQMHDRYDGRWFRTLTFIQTTIQHRPDGTVNRQTWYEALRAPDRLRIDFGELSAGNGVLYTADSVYVVRAGKVATSRGEGNPFLPFVVGIYTQPLERTLAQLAPYHFDLGAIRDGEWRGRPVYIVGAHGANDLTSSQFWIDRDRLVLVRALLAPPASGPGATMGQQDFLLDDYVETGGGWLATKVTISIGGTVRQTEEYADWRPNVDLPDDLFEPSRWSMAPHWARGRDAR